MQNVWKPKEELETYIYSIIAHHKQRNWSDDFAKQNVYGFHESERIYERLHPMAHNK